MWKIHNEMEGNSMKNNMKIALCMMLMSSAGIFAMNNQNDSGVNLNAKKGSYTPLMHAAQDGNVPLVQSLLNQDGADVNYQGWDGTTALHHAAYQWSKDAKNSDSAQPSGNAQIIQLLIAHGADTDIKAKPIASEKTPIQLIPNNSYNSEASDAMKNNMQQWRQDYIASQS